MRKFFLTILFFYLLALLQTSFLVHFPLKGYILNLTLILVIFLNLFERPSEKLGLASAFFGGFFLDIFSESFFGFWILILLVVSLLIKYVFKKYVRIPRIQKI